MTREELGNLFDSIYKKDSHTLDLAILELRKNDATQMDTISVLKQKLSISLREADKIILNSTVWKDRKSETEELRRGFDKTFDTGSKEVSSKENILWEKKKQNPL